MNFARGGVSAGEREGGGGREEDDKAEEALVGGEGGVVQGAKRGLIATFILEMARITALRGAGQEGRGPGGAGRGGKYYPLSCNAPNFSFVKEQRSAMIPGQRCNEGKFSLGLTGTGP